ICMDMCMVDLDYMPDVDIGSEIEIFGPENPVDGLARTAGTIPYELLCAVNKRVPRIFLRGGKVIGSEHRMFL
ncbi:MAG: alanine racemase, partial [Lachnospiraceae bacterium]|nr:alanine racemase [Lachnospiraceae bacterium]